MIPLGLLFVFVCQDPSPPAAPRALDVVELKNGDQLQGRIVTEIDGFLEIEIEAGARVGFSTAQVAAVRRFAVAPPGAHALVPVRSEWFVLHDATGGAVGWLSTSVTHRDDGGFTVNEEYEFQSGSKRYQVTSMAIADRDAAPVTAYFRERISEPVLATSMPGGDNAGAQERIVAERIVEAQVRGSGLYTQRLDRSGRKERELPWLKGLTFPLLARTLARTRGANAGAATMFDPAVEEMVVRSYDAAHQRSVVIDGKPVRVTELAETTPAGRNSEWVDASSRTLRRELAGPALVAVPSSLQSAKLAVGAHTIAGAVVAEAGGTFGLWIPNPAWSVREEQPAGQLALTCAAHGALASLSRIDHLEPGTPLEAAADAVTNWFRLLQPELAIVHRSPGLVRERAAVQLVAEGSRGGTPTRAVVDVIPDQDRYLVFVCVAPIAAWDELAADFVFLRRSVELDARALAPKLQGPIAERAAKAQPKGGAKKPAAEKRAPARPPAGRMPRDG